MSMFFYIFHKLISIPAIPCNEKTDPASAAQAIARTAVQNPLSLFLQLHRQNNEPNRPAFSQVLISTYKKRITLKAISP